MMVPSRVSPPESSCTVAFPPLMLATPTALEPAALGDTAPATSPPVVSRKVTFSPISKVARSAWALGRTGSFTPITVTVEGAAGLG